MVSELVAKDHLPLSYCTYIKSIVFMYPENLHLALYFLVLTQTLYNHKILIEYKMKNKSKANTIVNQHSAIYFGKTSEPT